MRGLSRRAFGKNKEREDREGGDISVQHRIMLAPLCLHSFLFLVLLCFLCSYHGCMCVFVVALAASKLPAANGSSRICCRFCRPGAHLGANHLQPKQPPRSPRQQPGPAAQPAATQPAGAAAAAAAETEAPAAPAAPAAAAAAAPAAATAGVLQCERLSL